MAQSYAILRYAGTLVGLYPTTDALLALRIDELTAVLDQLHNWWYPAFAEQDPDKQRALRETLVEETISKFLGGLDKRVGEWAKPFATGDKFTVADLAIYGVLNFLKNGKTPHLPGDVVDEFPALMKIYSLVLKHPKVAAYYAARDDAPLPKDT